MASLYIHIPFCEKKCVYCDFYSVETLSSVESFLDALHREIDLYAEHGAGTSFETIFFGGGTPSLLTPDQLGSILTRLRNAFAVTPDAEVTLETNPGTVTLDTLVAYRSLGVNRLSIGVQSFHDDELKFLSRIHDSKQAIHCIQLAREAGFCNISIDLIYSLPGQTLEGWAENLERAQSLKPDHMSAYSLIVEDHTPLARMVRAHQVSPNPVEVEARLYEFTMEFMARHGFEHYEVSNYALPGFRSRHNYNYWCHKNYLGFGPSAHSFWKKLSGQYARRWTNISQISTYCSRLQEDALPVAFEENVGMKDLANERIFLGLRSDGLNIRRMQADFGLGFSSGQEAILRGLIDCESAFLENDSFRLTPKGFLICDEIAERLMF